MFYVIAALSALAMLLYCVYKIAFTRFRWRASVLRLFSFEMDVRKDKERAAP